MFKYILLILSILLFIGCTKNTPNNSVRQYKNINKDAILNATKRVLLLSDKEFLIHSSRNKIIATKRMAINKGFTVNINENKISLEAYEDENITKAKLIITKKEDFIEEDEIKVEQSVYDLLWSRIEYILGINKTWTTCLDYRIKLNFDGILCDIAYNTNTKPTSNDIIKDTSIKSIVIPDNSKKINLADINMSIYDNISLPLSENKITTDISNKENNNTNIDIDNNATIENIVDINNSINDIYDIKIEDINIDEDNKTNMIKKSVSEYK